MNVLFVSQCSKRALSETRRILDQFAERRGERTWQTPITQAGLDTVRRLLRKTARKNTAVACHWIRGLDHSELLWIVGDASQFNALGAAPTNSTARDVLRTQDENDWHSGEDIRLLAALAALLHDLGKASRAFQQRLKHGGLERNQYRHEWTSLRLFQAFVGEGDDEQWLQRLITPSTEDDASWLSRLQRDGIDAVTDKPFARLPPLAAAIGWLVLTHHRLPAMPERDSEGLWRHHGAKLRSFQSAQVNDLLGKIDVLWNELPTSSEPSVIAPYWQFEHGLPVTTALWRKRAARLAQRLLERLPRMRAGGWLQDPYVMHVSRLCLMLADHHYSSLSNKSDRVTGEAGYPLHANTRRDTGALNQGLDEHLLGVERHASLALRALPELARNLPSLARHKGLRQRSTGERFQWQNKAADLASGLREASLRHGFFGINLASTGCGKTLANARIMNALATPQHGLRCVIALGLRTLTLQSGHALRQRLALGEDELAIRVGGGASRELFELHTRLAAQAGSESAQPLPEDESFGEGGVLYEGNTDSPVLARLSADPRIRALLTAPILVCTVDHLAPATESQRGGHQIVPMLRLMSSDLVLDELDDFDLDDLPALTRLVHWAGLLGSRVLLSSATLPPALVQGMFLAYRAGREIFQRNRGERPGSAPDIACAWFDEFASQAHACGDAASFESSHLAFASARHAKLGQASREAPRRLARLVPFSPSKAQRVEAFAATLREQALALHAVHHSIDPASGKRVSFGLVRMANIRPLIEVAQALYAQGFPAGYQVHLCVYHAQYPLLLRSAIEAQLDAALARHTPDAVFKLPDIRQRLDAHAAPDQLFIVLGSPVTEVGRDHDYDWAIVEPSSMRSLIQLAGRVQRHRNGVCTQANIAVLSTNLRHIEKPGEPAFCKPGFEDAANLLGSHDLAQLLHDEEYTSPDSRPRIQERPPAVRRPQDNLVDLEHARLRELMLPGAEAKPLTARELRAGIKPTSTLNASSIWSHSLLHLTAVLSQRQPFRDDDVPEVELVLMPDDDGEDYRLKRARDKNELIGVSGPGELLVEASEERLPASAVQGEQISAWGVLDYMDELRQLAETLDMPLAQCARRYGSLRVPKNDRGWCFHPALGLSAKR
ncbi:type I-F CRISPR-associated helicase Cas3f [Uliginosibacterium sediminicola]|uniref:Type I-F CRISPR-associated helicase Cas3f n=1 Tax=Uliginosibacterium sediminicola TaxID=2024550 RepID=A0ABU9Z1N2_9RHOO